MTTFVGDNDHGDTVPTPITDPNIWVTENNGWVTGDYGDTPEPKCEVCGVPWADHMGIMGVCLWNKALMEDLVNLRKDNAQLYKERDEADFSLSRILSEISCRIEHGADSNGHLEGIYELFKKEKTP